MNWNYLKYTFLCSLFLCAPFSISAQTVWSEFMARYEGGDVEYGYGVAQTPDGNFMIAGNIGFGPGGSDACLMKIDPGGTQIQTLAFGGSNGEDARDIVVSRDRAVVFTGQTSSFGSGSTDVLVAKVNALGQVVWARAIGGTANDYGMSIDTTRDGGYIIGGYTYSFGFGVADVYAIKLDANGNIQWTRVIGGTGNEFCFGVAQTDDDGYVLSGYTFSFGVGTTDYYGVKLNSNGTLAWTRTFGGAAGSDVGYRVMSARDGDIIFSGYSTGLGAGGGDGFLVKVDLGGNLTWARTFGSAGLDRVFDVFDSYDGNLVCTGEGTSNTFGSGDQQVFKIDFSGNLIWSRHYGTNVDETGFGHGMETSDNGILFTGWDDNDEDFLVTKLDSNGLISCNTAPMTINGATPSISVGSGGSSTTGGFQTNIILPVGPNLLSPVVYCSTVLPIEWIRVSSEIQPDKTILTWRVKEQNIVEYQIEKSIDGHFFFPVGEVSSQRSDDIHQYTFADSEIILGETWYRVVSRDEDGTANYSQVIPITRRTVAIPLQVTLPHEKKRHFELHSFTPDAEIAWELFTTEGKLIRQGTIGPASFPPKLQFDNVGSSLLILNLQQKGKGQRIKLSPIGGGSQY